MILLCSAELQMRCEGFLGLGWGFEAALAGFVVFRFIIYLRWQQQFVGLPLMLFLLFFFLPILPDWGVKSLIHFYVRPNNKPKCQICCEMLNCLSTDWGTATTTITTTTKATTTTGYWNMTMTFGGRREFGQGILRQKQIKDLTRVTEVLWPMSVEVAGYTLYLSGQRVGCLGVHVFKRRK